MRGGMPSTAGVRAGRRRGRPGGGGRCTGAPSRPLHWLCSPQVPPGVREGQVLSAVPPRVSSPEWLSDLLWLGEVLVGSELSGGKRRGWWGELPGTWPSPVKYPWGGLQALNSRRVEGGWDAGNGKNCGP